jgi:hypothetical protein
LVAAVYPDYDRSKASAYQQTRNRFSTGKEATQVNALNTAIGHLKTAKDSLDKIGFLGTTPLVGGIARFKGSHDAVMLDTAKGVMQDEIHNAWSTKAITDTERDEMQKKLGSASPMELGQRINDYTQLLGTKMENLQQQFDDATPSGAIEPMQLMHGNSLASYKAITGQDAPETLQPRQRGSQSQGGYKAQVQQTAAPRPGEKAVVVNGKTVGYSADGGRTMRSVGQ